MKGGAGILHRVRILLMQDYYALTRSSMKMRYRERMLKSIRTKFVTGRLTVKDFFSNKHFRIFSHTTVIPTAPERMIVNVP